MSDSPSGPAGLPPVRPQPPPQPNIYSDAATPYASAPGYPPQYYAPNTVENDPGMRWVLPVGTSVWAIASGYCGLLSLAVCFLGPVAIICGILAIRETNADPNLSGLGRAIFGIVTGAIGTIGLVFFIIMLVSNPR